MLYSEQLRAARALLRWEQSTVAAEARISVETVKRLERLDGPLIAVKVATVEAIRNAFEAAGIEFIEPEDGVRGPGVALKWGASAAADRAQKSEGDGDGSGGLKALQGAEAIAAYWRARPKEWAALSQTGRNVLSVEMFGFPEAGDEAFGG
jgi:transcriptional regulator with XRE-family HTH domain